MHLLALLVIEIYIYHAKGFSQGAGEAACSTMMPGHNANASSGSPFSLTAHKASYGPNEIINVTVSGGYTGLLLQARKAGGSDTTAIGTFSSPPSGMQLKTCGTADSSITHQNKNAKSEMVMTWNSPATSAGPIEFIATFVEMKTMFWMGTKSGILDPAAGYPTEPPPTATTASADGTTQEDTSPKESESTPAAGASPQGDTSPKESESTPAAGASPQGDTSPKESESTPAAGASPQGDSTTTVESTSANNNGTQGGSGTASGLSFGYVTLLMTLVVTSL